ncbi:hypothetical protein [Alkalispirillum mobile]|jgi:hypothetical protein|uniref:hypothetical protein n=1 Tax=Alkalispirillum mobile TaxID=85925 RepID=UPI0011C44A9E|nr:hypothetical protein [Alkalispirillum mobile]
MTEIELLQQIADNTSTNTNLWVAVIAATAAISGAIVTGILQYFTESKRAKRANEIEEKKLRANIVATERLRWLQDVRERLSKLYTHLDMQYSFLKRAGNPAQLQQTLDEYSFVVMQEIHHISLLLNPEKPDQKKLKRALAVKQKILLKCFSRKSQQLSQIHDKRYALVKNIAFNSLTTVGARTWRQIKDLD